MKRAELLCVLLVGAIPLRGCTGCAKTASKAVTKTAVAKVASREADDVAKIAMKPKVVPHMAPPTESLKLLNHVQQSKTVGSRLVLLQSRIPARAYAQLYRQWQNNDAQLYANLAEVKQLESRCTCGGVFCSTCSRRRQLEERSTTLAERNAQIERLLDQYG